VLSNRKNASHVFWSFFKAEIHFMFDLTWPTQNIIILTWTQHNIHKREFIFSLLMCYVFGIQRAAYTIRGSIASK
jgi:hypothetical protein